MAIHNPTSGGGERRRDLPLILKGLEGQGFAVDERPTTGPGSATELAASAAGEGFDVVCVLGGDGTVNEALNGLAGGEVPLAIIPTGTVNVLAMELGIPLDPPDAVRVVGRGTESWIDLGLAGERYFGLMAGIGMDAAVVASLNPTLKKALKEAAFAVHGVATYLTHDEPLFRLTSDEREVEGYFAVFGNAANYGGAFGITPLADMRDGLLDVCVLTDKSFLSTGAAQRPHRPPQGAVLPHQGGAHRGGRSGPGGARADRRRGRRRPAHRLPRRAAGAARARAVRKRRRLPCRADAALRRLP